MDVIVGTAGHIDHGKTALIKALTGIDADRLPEEKERGITIDLGFAEMTTGDVRIGFVDVPGHERFVKNMLAGASGIDLVMLVIAADEGVMPQTREHFDICRLLRIRKGVIVLTKADLADAEMLELAKLDAGELVHGSFLEDAPVFAVSSRTGEGIAELQLGLADAARGLDRESGIYEPRLPIDRSFSVKGFGAVVTGTLANGEIAEGDELELSPIGRRVRVRGIQTHGKSVAAAHAGQRTAINLAGAVHDEISRGMVISVPGTLSVTQVLDAEVEVLADSPRPIRSRQRVRVHLGSSEVMARVLVLNESHTITAGSTGFAQLRLESPLASVHGERFIIRSYSPQRTIGGGRVLHAKAARHRRSDLANASATLNELSEAADGLGNAVEIFVRMAGARGARLDDIRSETGHRRQLVSEKLKEAVQAGSIVDCDGVFVSRPVFERLRSELIAAVEGHHRNDKLSKGMPRETVREQVFRRSDVALFREVTSTLEREGKIVFDQDVFKLASHETQLSPAETATRDKLRKIYSDAVLEVPKLEDALRDAAAASGLDPRPARKVFQLLVNSGELVAVTTELYFTAETLTALTSKLRDAALASGDRTIDVAKFKEIAGISRKYAIPLLEYFDRTRVTRRLGDKREIL